MQLQGKVAIVTGGSKGIGEGIVRRFVAEGAKVAIADIDQESAESLAADLTSDEVGVKAFHTDVSAAADVAKLFADVRTEFGQLDIVVNNAGIYPFVNLSDMTEVDWDKLIDINLKSIFLMSKEAANTLPSGGRIISIASIASLVGFESLSHYCASKAGIIGFSRALALELAVKQITVNTIAPGAIETPGANFDQMSDEAKQGTLSKIPLGRFGKPADIAGAVAFLASEDASYITGQNIVVDGGWTASS